MHFFNGSSVSFERGFFGKNLEGTESDRRGRSKSSRSA